MYIQLAKILLVSIAASIFVASCLVNSSNRTVPVTLTGTETPVPPPVRNVSTDFSTFSHEVPEHRQFACDSCHRREGGVEIRFAAHEACVGCHLNQFTSTEGQICSICHQETRTQPPPVRAFPAKFEEGFNMKFDHSKHLSGEGRPAEGCASCHAPRGAGKTIPAGIQAHSNCYECHTPQSKIGSCSVCHELAPYSRTPQSRYLFTVIFSHADHRMSCTECHTVRPGAPQSRQVTSAVAFEHPERGPNPGGVTCYTCHNGTRAFGGGINDFSNCRRCHTRDDFKVF
ncbi:MAG: cytochrome c3 family protein [Pyrinomonadaceae bacterium]